MRLILYTVLFLFSFHTAVTQNKTKQYAVRTLAFYNLENLFDTIDNRSKKDELSPIMELKWCRSKVYWDRITKLGYVISKIGRDKTKTSPALIGVAEVENDTVLKDLIHSRYLHKKGYDFIHIESPDQRGIDVALLYQKHCFKPIHYQAFNPNIYQDNTKIHTRDILWVAGHLDGEEIHIIVNHWPSRRGGEEKTRPLREKAAYKVTQIIEKIRENDKNAKIIVMGDFNDDPINSSFKTVLKTKKEAKNANKDDLYNPFEKLFYNGFNTLGYRDHINLFDQILVTGNLIIKKKNKQISTYKMFKPSIFNKPFLTQKTGRFKAYPFRSFSNGTYTGGYSDHYPVYMYLIKQNN